MNGFIHHLKKWASENASLLRKKGVLIDERFPQTGSNVPWKASIGLKYGDVVVEYTVWEKDVPWADLIVANKHGNQTIVMTERALEGLDSVDRELGEVVAKLLDHTFRNSVPDSKLLIT